MLSSSASTTARDARKRLNRKKGTRNTNCPQRKPIFQKMIVVMPKKKMSGQYFLEKNLGRVATEHIREPPYIILLRTFPLAPDRFFEAGSTALGRDDVSTIYPVNENLTDQESQSEANVDCDRPEPTEPIVGRRTALPTAIAAMPHVEINNDCKGSPHQFRGFLLNEGRASLL